MAAAFDPYRAWLGVVSSYSPPTHYELLGVAPSRANGEAIAEAFRRQMARLNPHLAGEHAAVAQKVAAELSNARVVLLTPTTKRAYDAELAARIKAKQGDGAAQQRSQPQAQPAPTQSADDLLPPSAGSMPPAAPEPTATLVQPPSPNVAPGGPPLNQPPPPGVAAPYPPMPPAAGQVQPQVYGQPYPPAYPAGGTPQPVQALPYGQPYPQAAQPFPGQQPYPPQAAPGYPAAGFPAAAPQEAPVEVQPDHEIASLPSGPSSTLSRTAGRKRSSPVPMLVGLTVAGAVVVGGVIYFVKSDAGAQVAVNKSGTANGSNSQPSPTQPAPGAAAGKNSPATQGTSNGQRQPGAVAPSQERIAPVIAPKMTSDQPATGGSKEKLFQPDGDGENMTDSPSAGESPDGMKPEAKESGEKPGMPASEANKAAAASASAPGDSEMLPEVPEDKAAIETALNAARQALANREPGEAEIQLAQATLEATSRESLAKVDRLQLLAMRVGEFWNAVRETLPSLQAGESFDVDGEEVNVVEASAEKIVIRVAGRNREYQLAKMPAKLAATLAARWLEEGNPVSSAVLGAFQAVDPQGDRQQARLLFQQARAGGMNVDPLLEELDVLEGAGS